MKSIIIYRCFTYIKKGVKEKLNYIKNDIVIHNTLTIVSNMYNEKRKKKKYVLGEKIKILQKLLLKI